MEWFYQTHSVCQLVGSLIYLTMTCPFIPHAVQIEVNLFVLPINYILLVAGLLDIYMKTFILDYFSPHNYSLEPTRMQVVLTHVAQLLAGVFFLRFSHFMEA